MYFFFKINKWGNSAAKWCFAHQTSTIRHQKHFFVNDVLLSRKAKQYCYNVHTYFERETFHWTLWCCNLYLWVIMVSDVLLYVREARQWQKQGKVIHPKYSKHWPYTVAKTIDCLCSKMLNHGLNNGLFLSLFKLIPCPIHWIVYLSWLIWSRG